MIRKEATSGVLLQVVSVFWDLGLRPSEVLELRMEYVLGHDTPVIAQGGSRRGPHLLL